VPIPLFSNSGLTSAPRRPQALQVNLGSRSDSRTSSPHRAASQRDDNDELRASRINACIKRDDNKLQMREVVRQRLDFLFAEGKGNALHHGHAAGPHAGLVVMQRLQ
jgi:hypothetical protein